MKVFILLSLVAAAYASHEACGENQHYESCGTACPLTCENYRYPPFACVLMCNPGCHCDKGFVKTRDERCVKPEQCPPEEVCGENEHYTGCGTACPLTCDNYDNPPKFCNLMCKIGCECKKGFVRTRDGRCVRPEECPVISPFGSSDDVCSLEFETGPCQAYFRRFFFNKKTGKCERFVYGGCRGNGNNFKTIEECERTCGSSVDVCSFEAETGLCDAYFKRFFFNKKTGKCEDFVYGGCGGNGNNFESIEQCERRCGVAASTDVCSLPVEVGPCRARIPRYFFNKNTGECEQFFYGGCRGNENNFVSSEECSNACA